MPEANSRGIHILLVGGQALMRAGLRALIESHPGFHVTEAGGSNGVAPAGRWDLILFDLDMPPPLDGLTAVPAIALASAARPDAARRALAAGARGLVFKEQPADVLLRALRKVHHGETFFDPAMLASLVNGGPAPGPPADPEAEKIAALTRREQQIIRLVAEGRSNRHIAEQIFISQRTVRHHLSAIFRKLEVPDRVGLIVYSYHHHLVDISDQGGDCLPRQ